MGSCGADYQMISKTIYIEIFNTWAPYLCSSITFVFLRIYLCVFSSSLLKWSFSTSTVGEWPYRGISTFVVVVVVFGPFRVETLLNINSWRMTVSVLSDVPSFSSGRRRLCHDPPEHGDYGRGYRGRFGSPPSAQKSEFTQKRTKKRATSQKSELKKVYPLKKVNSRRAPKIEWNPKKVRLLKKVLKKVLFHKITFLTFIFEE